MENQEEEKEMEGEMGEEQEQKKKQEEEEEGGGGPFINFVLVMVIVFVFVLIIHIVDPVLVLALIQDLFFALAYVLFCMHLFHQKFTFHIFRSFVSEFCGFQVKLICTYL